MSNKKITKEELDKLVAANRMYRDLKFAVADIEMSFERLKEQKTLTMEQLNGATMDLSVTQQEIYDKYGDVQVNLQTGEYN
jgi:hypothetical protein